MHVKQKDTLERKKETNKTINNNKQSRTANHTGFIYHSEKFNKIKN